MLTKPRPIRLKGRSFLALALTPELPFEDWLKGLDDLAARSAGFFLRRPVVLEVTGLDINKTELRDLVEKLAARNVRVMGIEGARPSLLGPDMPPAMTDGRPASDFDEPAADAPKADDNGKAAATKPGAELRAAPAVAMSLQAPAAAMPSMIVTEPVRSGQSLFFPEGDITIIGSVASGAEVVAGGSIHVYGTLRGRAMAGTTGNAASRIFCRKMEAELIAIDGFYQTAEDMEPDLRGRAVQVWLESEKLRMGTLG